MHKQGLLLAQINNPENEDGKDSDYSGDEKKAAKRRQRVNSLRSDKLKEKLLNTENELSVLER